MAGKAPVMLVVVVDGAGLRWHVASLSHEGRALPLLRSEDGDLAKVEGRDFDEQLDFLRHRLCGVVQRGCDRLWGRDLRAEQFVFLFEGPLGEATGSLLQAIAEHFTAWMVNPPAVVFRLTELTSEREPLAGTLTGPLDDLLASRLAEILAARATPEVWELSRKKT